ncbi:AbrB/MazE/SpoVT family DNA-binding domain-containing protein [Halochromatium roseum]|uniref:AbrB/MazE/SpoVT family DNA-binding domain-containing protein n=1 Tax=Halochromatium roseum TaxID=391920 RepID=UPI001914AF92
MPAATVNELGQVQIPQDLRQRLGIGQGSRVRFDLVDDHLEMRVEPTDGEPPATGFGMLKASAPQCPPTSIPPRWFNRDRARYQPARSRPSHRRCLGEV